MKSRTCRLIVIIVFLGLYSSGRADNLPPEPIHNGQTLTYWMQHWSRMYGSREIEDIEPKEALKQIGTNAIPYFLNWIQRRETYGPDFNYPGHALKGFEFLGSTAKSAIPD